MRSPLVVPLALLAARRALPPVALVAFALLVWFAATSATPPLDWLGDDALALVSQRGLAREAGWSAVTLVGAPWIAWRAARAARTWRGRDSTWLAASGIEPWRAVASTWLGLAIASALMASIALVAGELAARGSDATWRRAGVVDAPSAHWVTFANPARWTIATADAWDRNTGRIECALELGSGRAAACEVEFIARRGESERRARASIRERGRVEVDVPSGSGPIELELRVSNDDDRAFVPRGGCTAWITESGERAGSRSILVRVTFMIAALAAVSLGMGTWVEAPLAVILALVVALAMLEVPSIGSRIAGADVFEALEDVVRGRNPSAIPFAAFFGTSLSILAGLGLARAGYGREGRTR